MRGSIPAKQGSAQMSYRPGSQGDSKSYNRNGGFRPCRLLSWEALSVIPAGLLARGAGQRKAPPDSYAKETERIELAAMSAVMAHERQLGYEPRDVSADKCGYDVESRIPGTGSLRFIEVKGRAVGATTVQLRRMRF